MAFHNPKGRANYEPNSWGKDGGPRENPEKASSPTRRKWTARRAATGPKLLPSITVRPDTSTWRRPMLNKAI